MKFDKFLAKLFSRRVLLSIISIILLVLFLSSCMLTAEDCLMCMFCGCFTPETTCAINECITNCICDCICDCAYFTTGGCAECVYKNVNCKKTPLCDCVVECMTDDEGNPIDCEDVGCPECQKYFECT